MTSFTHVVAIGASAGGIEAISDVVSHLPANFRAPVVAALHSRETLAFPDILDRCGPLPARVVNGEATLAPAKVFVCPGGKQSYFEGDRIIVTDDKMGLRFSPSVDVLFSSLAKVHGPRGIAVVMSGRLNDGTIGALLANQEGATTLVQSPDEARYEEMPSSVILNDHPDSVLPAAEIAERLVDLVGTG